MATSNANIAEAIYLSLKGVSKEEETKALHGVVHFLNKKKLLSKANDILLRLQKIINHHERRLEAKVFSATPLDGNTSKEIAEILIKRYGVKEVNLVESIDPTLLGGFKIDVDGEVIDLSIKNKINKLQAHLIKNV